MLDRRAFRDALGLLAWPPATRAQPPARTYRMGYLGESGPEQAPFLRQFTDGLQEMGYVEGTNLVIERRWASLKYDRLPDLATELVRLNLDVIAAGARQPSAR